MLWKVSLFFLLDLSAFFGPFDPFGAGALGEVGPFGADGTVTAVGLFLMQELVRNPDWEKDDNYNYPEDLFNDIPVKQDRAGNKNRRVSTDHNSDHHNKRKPVYRCASNEE